MSKTLSKYVWSVNTLHTFGGASVASFATCY